MASDILVSKMVRAIVLFRTHSSGLLGVAMKKP
jgi:hypothetical protein